MKKYVLILAGGRGSRMKSETPKQFIKINEKTVLEHTIEKFQSALPEAKIILVLPHDQLKRWEKISRGTPLQNLITTIGGSSRFQSVRNGLQFVPDDVLLAIHDGVRPLVSPQTIENVFHAAAKFGACIPLVPLKESLRKNTKENFKAVDRSEYRLVQTPQCFQSKLIKEAYSQQNDRAFFTDDASVYEAKGGKLSFVDGNEENIKLTHAFELKIIAHFLKSQAE